jgi:hypothetical protein
MQLFISAHVFAYDQSPKHAQSFTFGLNYTAGTVLYVALYVIQAVFVQTPRKYTQSDFWLNIGCTQFK